MKKNSKIQVHPHTFCMLTSVHVCCRASETREIINNLDKNLNRIMNKDKNIIKLNIVVVDKSKAHPKEEVFP